MKINDIVGNGISGILYKWVNYGKGWRPRWFVLQDGVLSSRFTDPIRSSLTKEQRKDPKSSAKSHLKVQYGYFARRVAASNYEDLPDMVAIKDANFSDVDAKPLCTQYVGRYHPAYKGNDFNRDGDEMVPLTEMVMKWCLWDEVRHYIEEDEKLTIYMKWSNFAAGKMYPSESSTPVDGIYSVSPALFRSKSAILRS
ncbi:hypothetical protein SO802_010927 [Lithocarpus litseifolius]|uniref:PH domain-containing protein n=1 Tax=Lithocarpus litseifolius TaxID=425828 RepID=A0AAW2DJD1_9ROSI